MGFKAINDNQIYVLKNITLLVNSLWGWGKKRQHKHSGGYWSWPVGGSGDLDQGGRQRWQEVARFFLHFEGKTN